MKTKHGMIRFRRGPPALIKPLAYHGNLNELSLIHPHAPALIHPLLSGFQKLHISSQREAGFNPSPKMAQTCAMRQLRWGNASPNSILTLFRPPFCVAVYDEQFAEKFAMMPPSRISVSFIWRLQRPISSRFGQNRLTLKQILKPGLKPIQPNMNCWWNRATPRRC